MKTKFFKSVMPFLVMILAIGLSFAMDANKVVQMGYYDDPLIEGIQSEVTDCQKNSQNAFCKSAEGFQLYDTEDLDAIPNNELRRMN